MIFFLVFESFNLKQKWNEINVNHINVKYKLTLSKIAMVGGNVDSRVYAYTAHISICRNYANLAVSTYVPTLLREHLFAYINAHSVP